MLNPCLDNYSTTFADYNAMRRYHETLASESKWRRCKVNDLHIEPLDTTSALYATPAAFAPAVSEEAVKDTAEKSGPCHECGRRALSHP